MVKFCLRKIAEILYYLAYKKNKISAPSQTVATARIAPRVCQGQPATFASQLSKFHPNRRVERARAVLLANRVRIYSISQKNGPRRIIRYDANVSMYTNHC